MDILTEALNAARIRSTIHCPTEALGDWGISAGSRNGAKFCIVLHGACWLEAEGREPMRLCAGDFAAITRPLPHTIRTTLASPLMTLEDFLANHPKSPDGVVRCGAGGEKTFLVGGCFYFEDFQTSPLLRALPAVLHIVAEQGREFGMEATIQAVLAEALNWRSGTETVLTRLSEVLFIQALRAYFARLPEGEANWFRAALDPQIGTALTAIHQNPAHEWQVAALAAESAMSRSAFAARFTQLVGEPPLQHVTRWRIHKAARLLCEKNYSVAQVAAHSGYQSEAAFSKVFKQWTGQSPTAYRRAAPLS